MAAFCRRANAIGNIKTKGVTEEFYDEAVRAAKAVDERQSTERRNGGGDGGNTSSGALLQGMPISIKDAMNMKGAVSKPPDILCAFHGASASPTGYKCHLLACMYLAATNQFDGGLSPTHRFCDVTDLYFGFTVFTLSRRELGILCPIALLR